MTINAVYSGTIKDIRYQIILGIISKDDTFISTFGRANRDHVEELMEYIRKHFIILYDSGYTLHNYNHPEDPYNRCRVVIYEFKDEACPV